MTRAIVIEAERPNDNVRAQKLTEDLNFEEMSSISIIVPVYNVEQYLPKCLDSLLNQTFEDIEIVCVNDGSTDDSLKLLQDYQQHDTRIKIIDKKNGGVSSARNAGLDAISGEYFMFVDSDDWLEAVTCEITYEEAKKVGADCLMFSYVKEFELHPIINHIFPKDYICWHNKEVAEHFHRRLFGPLDEELNAPQDLDIIVSPCMQLFKTDIFRNNKFEDISQIGNFEDGLYQMDVYRNCRTFVYLDRPFYHYRKTNYSSITSKYCDDLIEKRMVLFDMIETRIEEWRLGENYKKAFHNRIALSTIGLGLNETNNNRSFREIVVGGEKVLSNRRLMESVDALDTRLMPLPWKFFFYLCKHRLKIPFAVMLLIIEYLRTHRHPTQ